MMSPGKLQDLGVPVYAIDQRPGEYVITFPKAYHAGFNHGFNFNEAVNFALPSWLPAGSECIERYKEYRKPPVFSHDEMLMTAVQQSNSSETAMWLRDSLKTMTSSEIAKRKTIRHMDPSPQEILEDWDLTEDETFCSICQTFCYLSRVTCDCGNNQACLEHASALCGCPMSDHILHVRFSDDYLVDLCRVIDRRANIPANWNDRFNAVISVTRPSLKVLKGLLSDVDRIPYPLDEKRSLADFIGKADTWIDSTLPFLSRKLAKKPLLFQISKSGHEDKLNISADRESDSISELSVEVLQKILQDKIILQFESPEIESLKQFLRQLDFLEAESARLVSGEEPDTNVCEDLIVSASTLGVSLKSAEKLEAIALSSYWNDSIAQEQLDDLGEEELAAVYEEGLVCGVDPKDARMCALAEQRDQYEKWQIEAEDLLNAEEININDFVHLNRLAGHGDSRTAESIAWLQDRTMKWQCQAQEFVTAASSYHGKLESEAPSLYEVIRLIKAVDHAKVTFPLLAPLRQQLSLYETWVRKLGELFYWPAKQKPIALLSGTLQTFTSRLDPRDDFPLPPSSPLSSKFTCLCRLEQTESDTTVVCASCSLPCHSSCLIPWLRPGKRPKEWYCPLCDPRRKEQSEASVPLNRIREFTSSTKYPFKFRFKELDLLLEIIAVMDRFRLILDKWLEEDDSQVPNLNTIMHFLYKLEASEIQLESLTHPSISYYERLLSLRRQVLVDPQSKGRKRTRESNIEDSFVKRRVRTRKPRLILVEEQPPLSALEKFPTSANCICGGTPPGANPEELAIGCDKCFQWYHLQCVGVGPHLDELSGTHYMCPICAVKANRLYRYADIRVQEICDYNSNTFVDVEATYKSVTKLVKRQMVPWNKSDSGIVLHLKQYIPGAKPEANDFVAQSPINEHDQGNETSEIRPFAVPKPRMQQSYPRDEAQSGATPRAGNLTPTAEASGSRSNSWKSAEEAKDYLRSLSSQPIQSSSVVPQQPSKPASQSNRANTKASLSGSSLERFPNSHGRSQMPSHLPGYGFYDAPFHIPPLPIYSRGLNNKSGFPIQQPRDSFTNSHHPVPLSYLTPPGYPSSAFPNPQNLPDPKRTKYEAYNNSFG